MGPRKRNELRYAGAAFLVLAALLCGCGGGSSGRALAEESIATQTRLLRQHLVSGRMIEQAAAGSARRAFLEYWRSVQFADIDRAIDAYESGLRNAIGTQLLALALSNASDVYRMQVPLVDETSDHGNEATVRYLATTQSSGDRVVALSTAWRRAEGRWRIRYSSALDGELRIAAQTRAQLNFRPGSQRLDPRAVLAGDRAAALQSGYLERLARAGAGEQP
jgi:hypothetical protein